MIDPTAVRKHILNMCYHSNLGHLGCSLSVVEILAAVYDSVDVEKIKRGDPDRDRCFLSKGHCAPAAYAVLAEAGIIDRAELDTYAQDGSRLAGLVSHACPGVELSTGALGHGINVAVGCALGLKRRKSKAKVYCVLGDAEMQEGAVWEGLMFAAHHRLDNLALLIDQNRIGSVTFTERVMGLELVTMLEGFGIDTLDIWDGHGAVTIRQNMKRRPDYEAPRAFVCHTIKGKGVSFMENEPVWHYRTLTAETYAQAMSELGEEVMA